MEAFRYRRSQVSQGRPWWKAGIGKVVYDLVAPSHPLSFLAFSCLVVVSIRPTKSSSLLAGDLRAAQTTRALPALQVGSLAQKIAPVLNSGVSGYRSPASSPWTFLAEFGGL